MYMNKIYEYWIEDIEKNRLAIQSLETRHVAKDVYVRMFYRSFIPFTFKFVSKRGVFIGRSGEFAPSALEAFSMYRWLPVACAKMQNCQKTHSKSGPTSTGIARKMPCQNVPDLSSCNCPLPCTLYLGLSLKVWVVYNSSRYVFSMWIVLFHSSVVFLSITAHGIFQCCCFTFCF